MATQTLKAEARKVFGRKVKKLRREGVLPANIYGKKIKSKAVQVALADFKKVFAETGETGVVEVKTNGDTHPVLIHNVQLHPVTDEPIHADFLQVDLKEKVSATVPVEFTGESPIEKTGEGVVVRQVNELEVEALPTDLPEKIIVDISRLVAVGDVVKIGDLEVDRAKVEVKDDPERIVVSIAEPAKEEVAPPPAPAEGEVPAEGAATGEAPAEGGAPAAEGEQKPSSAQAEHARTAEGKPEGGEAPKPEEAKKE